MVVIKKNAQVRTEGKGTYEITHLIEEGLKESGLSQGIVSVFVQHTSCSLVIMENADPSARVDLERFMEELVPENYPNLFIHTKGLMTCLHMLKWHLPGQVNKFLSSTLVCNLAHGKGCFYGSTDHPHIADG